MALLSALRYQSRTMKQKLVVLVLLTLFAWSPVFSAADTPETRRKEAERYLQVSPPKALFEDMADKMAETLPADQREQFKKLMTTQVDIAALSKAMIDAMVNGDGPPSGRWSAVRGRASSSIVFGEADPPLPQDLLPTDLAAFVLLL